MQSCARSLMLLAMVAALLTPMQHTHACCAVAKGGKPIVNADQTVIIIWDKKTKTQHFIRRPTFKTDDDDFGFIVPTPSQPELAESGDDAFPYIQKMTEPERKRRPANVGCNIGCGKAKLAKEDTKSGVKILAQKEVAGFKATVLEASDPMALAGWLKDNGFSYSQAVQDWAKPYIDQKWKFTALKVAAKKDDKQSKSQQRGLSTLRLTFKTDRPLFPYREPKSDDLADKVNAKHRLLRIYFIGDAKYAGELKPNESWGGNVAWANKLTDEQRTGVLEKLKLPKTTGPSTFYLTEFEDNWKYEQAPGDVYFARANSQTSKKRRPIYTSSVDFPDVTLFALVGVLLIPAFFRRRRWLRDGDDRDPNRK